MRQVFLAPPQQPKLLRGCRRWTHSAALAATLAANSVSTTHARHPPHVLHSAQPSTQPTTTVTRVQSQPVPPTSTALLLSPMQPHTPTHALLKCPSCPPSGGQWLDDSAAALSQVSGSRPTTCMSCSTRRRRRLFQAFSSDRSRMLHGWICSIWSSDRYAVRISGSCSALVPVPSSVAMYSTTCVVRRVEHGNLWAASG